MPDPLGKEISIFGRKVEIIGTFKEEGDNAFGGSNDRWVVLPVNFARNFIDLESRDIESSTLVKGKKNVSNEALRDELTGIMRSIRKLKPTVKDNFAINETSIITQGFDQVFGVVAIVGWIIRWVFITGWRIRNRQYYVCIGEGTHCPDRYTEILRSQECFYSSAISTRGYIFIHAGRDSWFAHHIHRHSVSDQVWGHGTGTQFKKHCTWDVGICVHRVDLGCIPGVVGFTPRPG